MATSEISICNIAISWLGGIKIISFDDNTAEAKLCSAVYPADRDAVLEQRNWSFALSRVKLNRLANDPLYGYNAAFQLPNDLIRMVDIATDSDFNNTLKDWSKEGDQLLVSSDVVFLRYIKRCEDPTKFSPGFIQCLAARIAADICVPLTSNVNLFGAYWEKYQAMLEEAGNMDGIQSRTQPIFMSKLIGAR